jgi:uncharacterized membrane protein YhaH (DUF805 family)
MKYYIEGIQNYFVYEGRTSRKAYWMFFLFNIIVAFGIGIISGIIGDQQGILNNLYTLFIFLPGIMIAIRRMHDTDRSGWYAIIPIYSLIICMFEGDHGENRFGPEYVEV